MATTHVQTLSNELVDLVGRASEHVVQVRGPAGRPTTGTILGQGRVLAIDHTLRFDEGYQVATRDGTILKAAIAGRDPSSDLTLLNVEGLSSKGFAVGADAVRPGQLAFIVGRTMQGVPSAAWGIVSAVARSTRIRGGAIDGIIRVDATPYPGISGSAVVDAEGRLVGIANGALQRGTSLAIPVGHASKVAEILEQHGRMRHGYLGVTTQAVAIVGQGEAGRGLLVMGVSKESPAERGGLLMGDAILSVDGRRIENPDDLHDLLTPDRIGRDMKIDVIRAGDRTAITVRVGERP